MQRESRRLASSQRRDYFGFRFRRYHGCAIHKRCCSGRWGGPLRFAHHSVQRLAPDQGPLRELLDTSPPEAMALDVRRIAGQVANVAGLDKC